MPTLTVLCGPPCAGKTTYAQRNSTPEAIVSLDECRLFVGPWQGDERSAVALFLSWITSRLVARLPVTVDATNLRAPERLALKHLAHLHGYRTELVLCAAPLAVATARNAHRMESGGGVDPACLPACYAQLEQTRTVCRDEGWDIITTG